MDFSLYCIQDFFEYKNLTNFVQGPFHILGVYNKTWSCCDKKSQLFRAQVLNKPDYPKHFCLKLSFLLSRGCKLPHLPKACVASWDLKVIVSVFTFARHCASQV